MNEEYNLEKITTETFIATCKYCGKPFKSDIEEKAIRKVTDHIRSCRSK